MDNLSTVDKLSGPKVSLGSTVFILIKKYGIHINKKVTNWGSKTPTWRALQGLTTETMYLCHSANAEDTILAGGSAASPKAPPYGSL